MIGEEPKRTGSTQMTRRSSISKSWIGARWLAVPILALAIPSGAGAQPVYLVDTSEGGSGGGSSLSPTRFLAGQFTLDYGSEINALEGWMLYLNVINNLPVYAVLYGDANGLPDMGNEIFSQLFFVPASGYVPGWYGVDGPGLVLYGGTDWLAFAPHPDAIGASWLAAAGASPSRQGETPGRKIDHAV